MHSSHILVRHTTERCFSSGNCTVLHWRRKPLLLVRGKEREPRLALWKERVNGLLWQHRCLSHPCSLLSLQPVPLTRPFIPPFRTLSYSFTCKKAIHVDGPWQSCWESASLSQVTFPPMARKSKKDLSTC